MNIQRLLVFSAMVILALLSCKNESKTTGKKQNNQQEQKVAPDYSKFGMVEEDVPYGLKKGDRAPAIDLLIEGVKTPLSALYKDQTIALFFYRGNWCPVCNKHLSDFTERAKDLTAKGIKLIAITPEDSSGIDKMREKTGANFTIVSDVDGSIQKAFDVDFVVTNSYAAKIEDNLNASIAANNANKKAELPVPATYVINRKGEIKFSHFDVNYKNRASVDDILNSVE
ncbi:AhpC/TSA family protein [Flavobacteriaceae bacterium F08102]|nr:AhpC/TSA family protein [Flavobacteriaceae bacterium F08102]